MQQNTHNFDVTSFHHIQINAEQLHTSDARRSSNCIKHYSHFCPHSSNICCAWNSASWYISYGQTDSL